MRVCGVSGHVYRRPVVVLSVFFFVHTFSHSSFVRAESFNKEVAEQKSGIDLVVNEQRQRISEMRKRADECYVKYCT